MLHPQLPSSLALVSEEALQAAFKNVLQQASANVIGACSVELLPFLLYRETSLDSLWAP